MAVTFPTDFDTSTLTEDDVDVADDGVDLTTAATCAGSEQTSVAIGGDVVTATICAGDGGSIASGVSSSWRSALTPPLPEPASTKSSTLPRAEHICSILAAPLPTSARSPYQSWTTATWQSRQRLVRAEGRRRRGRRRRGRISRRNRCRSRERLRACLRGRRRRDRL